MCELRSGSEHNKIDVRHRPGEPGESLGGSSDAPSTRLWYVPGEGLGGSSDADAAGLGIYLPAEKDVFASSDGRETVTRKLFRASGDADDVIRHARSLHATDKSVGSTPGETGGWLEQGSQFLARKVLEHTVAGMLIAHGAPEFAAKLAGKVTSRFLFGPMSTLERAMQLGLNAARAESTIVREPEVGDLKRAVEHNPLKLDGLDGGPPPLDSEDRTIDDQAIDIDGDDRYYFDQNQRRQAGPRI